jgi:hypothetical protein
MYIFISEGFPQTAFNGVTVNNSEEGGFLIPKRERGRASGTLAEERR